MEYHPEWHTCDEDFVGCSCRLRTSPYGHGTITGKERYRNAWGEPSDYFVIRLDNGSVVERYCNDVDVI